MTNKIPAGSLIVKEHLKWYQKIIKFFKLICGIYTKQYNKFAIYWLDGIYVPEKCEEIYVLKKPYSKAEKKKLIELLTQTNTEEFELLISVINTIRPNTFIPNANIKDITTNKYYKLLDEQTNK